MFSAASHPTRRRAFRSANLASAITARHGASAACAVRAPVLRVFVANYGSAASEGSAGAHNSTGTGASQGVTSGGRYARSCHAAPNSRVRIFDDRSYRSMAQLAAE